MQTHKQATARAAGLIYRIGAVTMVLGVLIVLCSGLLEGFVSTLYLQLLSLLGEEKDLVIPIGPETGKEIVLNLGGGIFITGAFVYAFRMSIELIGLPVERHLSRWYTICDKLALGIAAGGYVVLFICAILLFFLEEVLDDDSARALTSILNSILTASVWTVLGGLIIFFLKTRHLLRSFYGRAVSLGWGKLGWTRVNLTASGMVLIAFACQLFGWNSIFGLTMNTIIVTGLVMILSGVFPQFLASDKP